MGIALTVALALNTLPNDFAGVVAKYALAVSVGALYLILRRRDPETMIKQTLLKTDYLEAKKLIEDRKQQRAT